MPNLRKLIDSEPVRLKPLDVAELDGDGARAILLPDNSVFSSVFLGVNRAFCTSFGYESCEFQSNPLTILIGATTDTRRLQAMWQEAIRGSEEALDFDLYHKSGALRRVKVEFLPRALRCKQTASSRLENMVVVVRIHESNNTSPSLTYESADQSIGARLSTNKRRVRSSLIYDEALPIEEDEIQLEAHARPSRPSSRERHLDDDALDCDDSALPALAATAKDCLRPRRRPSAAASGEGSPLRTPKTRRASSALREAFPRAIAEAIMEGRRPEPIVRDCASVFFSDIVGFTTLSSTLDAARVSGLLTRLFAKFDALAQLHGVQKVDVIGDAYLAATNVLEDQAADHAARLARFAMDAVAAAAATRLDDADPASPAVQIRVGLHSGPASATVVGAQGYKYTLFGDTVNTASRMESTSLPGRIQCSAAAAALIADQDPLVPLMAREGGVEAKGKGLMRTCWVGRSAGQPVAAPSGTSIAAAEPGVRGAAAARSVGGFISFMRGRRAPPPGGGLAVF